MSQSSYNGPTAAPRRLSHHRDKAGATAPIDFGAVAALALSNARYLLARWFRAGRIQGRELTVGNIRGDRGDSLSISLLNGCWIDFAAPAYRGGDLLSLNAARLGVPQAEAARLVCAEIGVDVPTKPWDGMRRQSAPRPALPSLPKATAHEEVTEEQRRNITLALQRIWPERSSLIGSPAHNYLRTRGVLSDDVDEVPADLAFLPRCPRGSGTASAMIALLRDAMTMEPCGVHRTFIRPDGSGKDGSGGKAKMVLGRAKGAVITITPSVDVTMGLGICEGIEDAPTLLRRGWAPMWACISASGIGGLPVLPGVGSLTIFGDRDDAGLDGARDCAIRWADAGRDVAVHFPRRSGADWNAIHSAEAAA